MLVFSFPLFARLERAPARNPYRANQYIFVLASRYGMAVVREICVVNDSTRPWQKLQYSTGSKHLLMVFSPSGDSLIRILLPEEPPVIQITERSKESSLSAGDLETQNQVQVLPEVEILLDEQDSA